MSKLRCQSESILLQQTCSTRQSNVDTEWRYGRGWLRFDDDDDDDDDDEDDDDDDEDDDDDDEEDDEDDDDDDD